MNIPEDLYMKNIKLKGDINNHPLPEEIKVKVSMGDFFPRF